MSAASGHPRMQAFPNPRTRNTHGHASLHRDPAHQGRRRQQLKFDCGADGVAYIDGKSVPNAVSNENKDADCTVAITLANLAALLTGELEPATGFMMGKFKVSGDMSVAMKLQRVV